MAKKPWNECLEACLKTSLRINTDAIVWMEVAKKKGKFFVCEKEWVHRC